MVPGNQTSRTDVFEAGWDGRRGCVTTTSAEPIENWSPRWTEASSKPSVVKFSPKRAIGKSRPGSSRFPVVVMHDRVTVDRLMFTAVDAEVRLTVSVQIEFPQSDAAFDWLLVDRRSYCSPVPRHFSGKSSVDRNQFHVLPAPFR